MHFGTGMDGKNFIYILAIFLFGSCGQTHCPQLPNYNTSLPDGERLRIPLQLLARQDTIYIGDTLHFEGTSPLLPLEYGHIIFDEPAYIQFSYSIGEMTQMQEATESFIDYDAENITYSEENPLPNTRYKERKLDAGDKFHVGFVAQETGLYGIKINTQLIKFAEQSTPDYKASCERHTSNLAFDFANIKSQPLAELNQYYFREIYCAGNSCDTLITTYYVRVLP